MAVRSRSIPTNTPALAGIWHWQGCFDSGKGSLCDPFPTLSMTMPEADHFARAISSADGTFTPYVAAKLF
jgi:hypothetical protein